ncbi:acyl-CoA synthetase [Mycobacterium sp. 852013-50091_SCH5140682]|uniref:AMP-binding protein n=1 Tax=Mycobacterium sp. 852013-50091_SCH5140682 TaxID=1834109 RepID=UPI0007E9538F|nr:AMP-binding protein [Mycobacterium sp. 852013-50091_SCH5140682]OBC08347.1 acyl-CoA synthetase [Mycobacterium sp. 852013-50091_SCH5140682]
MVEHSLTALLRERASKHGDATAYTYLDFDVDPDGYPETLTWAEVYRRVRVVAEELRLCGAPGDRAAVLAPQGLEYIVGFLGAMHAGFVAVPLSVPQPGVHDERVVSVLRDCSPSVILTTTASAAEVAGYAEGAGTTRPLVIVEIDALDLDSPREPDVMRPGMPPIAYLQYTSGSTRLPAGVVVTHKNVVTNVDQALTDYFGRAIPPDATFVSWLPFYHDMGLIKGICAPLVCGRSAALMSPLAFLQRPARWMQLLATSSAALSAAPNFAFELAARRTTDDDMAGLDLGDVRSILSGSERVHAATLNRFVDRFAPFHLKPSAIRPSYGLAEATVYVATSDLGTAPSRVRFDYEKLSNGHARRCDADATGSTELIGHGTTRSTMLRIVDPAARTENPAGTVGEIWVHGTNVAAGYWHKSEETQRVFDGSLVNASPSTPAGPWLKTGDLGVISDGELFIIGRIKDLLIVDGSNHYPDDIEATIQELSNGRAAAISVPDGESEKLVAIVEVKRRRESDDDWAERLQLLKRELTSAISTTHRVRAADLVFVAPGSIPITTSGKVRRSACGELYRHDRFERLDGRR